MPALLRVAAALGLSVFVAGCSETSFQDVFGAGKDAPDETQVRTNQALTLPPDLSLKAPGTGAPPPPPVRTASAAPVQPPDYGAAPPGTTTASLAPAAPVTAAAPPAPGAATAPTAPGAAPATPAAEQDMYARYGISRNRPDGTPKKPAELREELRQKYVEMQRAKNPNYGTVLNMGNIWSDQ
ncbi:MAG: hypothetical protein ABWZ27_12035 [Aestuariivirgaceae bacterium]|jgi:hypothetical protein